MTQLITPDPTAATDFYGSLFGWTVVHEEADDFWVFLRGGAMNATMGLRPEGADYPAFWLPYFTVAEMDASVAKAEENGARTELPPTQIGDGWIATLLDPQGAAFALFEGEVDP
jgi:predicted enzyme related to lactoylglutathione lyase